MQVKSKLALLGGPKSVQSEPGNIFTWPIVTPEHEEAVLEVLRRGGMSGTDVTRQFEKEYADWVGTTYALGANTGTEALRGAMFGCGVGVGDEIISPSVTYWASCLPAFSLGATRRFCRHRPRYTLHRSQRHRAPHYRAHQGHRCRALLRSPRRHGPHHGDRAQAQRQGH